MDESDDLAAARDRFLLPNGLIYLNGNSLGPLSKDSRARALAVLDSQWGADIIASWNKHHWIDLPITVGDKIAALIGAAAGQVICCDSISVNLFKLLAQCLVQQSGRHTILSQQDNFPTDLYVAQGLQKLFGNERCELRSVAADRLTESLDKDVAVLLLSHVNFRDGALHDIARLTRLAHERGALVIWDLAHSAGVMPLELDAWDVDYAVGCGYKYLNGGPGAPAFIYANARHHNVLQQPIQGWMGHAAPFAFSPEYQGASGIASFLTGTPPVLSMAVLDAALDVLGDYKMERIRAKSVALSTLFADLFAGEPALASLVPVSPGLPEQRGSQLSFSHPDAYGICRAWAELGVESDFRAPDVLRVGFSPLLLSYQDMEDAISRLSRVMAEERHLDAKYSPANRPKVT